MKKVITYGTYDFLHYGHIRLLERAKALGDYLIVGVTTEDFDKRRGKINVKQSLMERIAAVEATGLADEIIVEEYEGQKIDDIKRYGVDIFTVGTDWEGQFDYLREYCEVVYLERTEGISSSETRSEASRLRLGFVGENFVLDKYRRESTYVNGIEVAGAHTTDDALRRELFNQGVNVYDDYESLLKACEAIYIVSHPSKHYEQVKLALENNVNVLCESPVALSVDEYEELMNLANEKDLILMDSLKTAYSTAYNRLLLLIKSGKIGKVLSVDATCTSLAEEVSERKINKSNSWNSMCAWGMTAMLPVLQILGTDYEDCNITSLMADNEEDYDIFTKIDFRYKNAVATIKAGKGVKSEGELVISGTKGYIYVPAPWWKTDYFELRFEHQEDNRRYFYQLEGEGIRYELVAFLQAIEKDAGDGYIDNDITRTAIKILERFYKKEVYRIG